MQTFAMHFTLDEGKKKKNQKCHIRHTFIRFFKQAHSDCPFTKSLLSAYKHLQTLAHSKLMGSLPSLTEGSHALVIMQNYLSMCLFLKLAFVVILS